MTGDGIGLALIIGFGLPALGLFVWWCWWMITGANDLERERKALTGEGTITPTYDAVPHTFSAADTCSICGRTCNQHPPQYRPRIAPIPTCTLCRIPLASGNCPHIYLPADGSGQVILSSEGFDALTSELSNLRSIVARHERPSPQALSDS